MMIRFGTDGWRAIIGDAFTFENVRKVARSHAEVLKERGLSKVLVGFDRRFLSEEFALEVGRVLRSEGLEVAVSTGPCTTPMVSFGVKYLGFDGGVMITASHNPPEYNGYKIKESFGGSATPEFIREVEKRIPTASGDPAKAGDLDRIDLKGPYINGLLSFFEPDLFRERELLVVHDAMHGSAAGLMADLLLDSRVSVLTIRSSRDPLFGGEPPEPVEKHLRILRKKVLSLSADLGVANDGDGDRIALVDERGNFVNSQILYALLLYHLVKNRRKRKGIVVKTVSTTYLADRICRSEGIELREVPVGFKNINEVFLKEKVIFGGEESGGYGFPELLPERDGVVSALMILEMILTTDMTVSEAVSHITKVYGDSFYKRVDLPVDERARRRLEDLRADPPTRVGSRPVVRVNTADGIKMVFGDESWILMRPSGTEPLIRIYAEAPSEKEVSELIRSGEELITV